MLYFYCASGLLDLRWVTQRWILDTQACFLEHTQTMLVKSSVVWVAPQGKFSELISIFITIYVFQVKFRIP